MKTVQSRLAAPRVAAQRIDLLEIRLFGLPEDPKTGAKKLDGEFDRIDKRLDDLPGEIITALRDA